MLLRYDPASELRSSEIMRTVRLHWFGHMEGKNENDWVNSVKHFEVEGTMSVGRSKKTWNEIPN